MSTGGRLENLHGLYRNRGFATLTESRRVESLLYIGERVVTARFAKRDAVESRCNPHRRCCHHRCRSSLASLGRYRRSALLPLLVLLLGRDVAAIGTTAASRCCQRWHRRCCCHLLQRKMVHHSARILHSEPAMNAAATKLISSSSWLHDC